MSGDPGEKVGEACRVPFLLKVAFGSFLWQHNGWMQKQFLTRFCVSFRVFTDPDRLESNNSVFLTVAHERP